MSLQSREQSHVASHSINRNTVDVVGLGALRLLEAIAIIQQNRQDGAFYQAGSSEM